MKCTKKQFDKRSLGRAADCGRVSFKTGAILTRKDRSGNRNSKIARRNLRRQLNGDE